MRQVFARSLVAGVIAALASSHALATTPSVVNYQGILTNSSGTPQVGTFSVTFSIYGVEFPSSDPSLWSETQSVTTDTDGRFNVLLGAATALGNAVFSGPDRWLAIRVSPDLADMAPRTRIATVAYAFRPATVDGASGGTITSKVSIGPGHTNSGFHGFVAGESNMLTGNHAVISGGQLNSATGQGSVVAGGLANTASGEWATVPGGTGNAASGRHALVSGGRNNTASGDNSLICGGISNQASAVEATIGGGSGNVADGIGSVIDGGAGNEASGLLSHVGGGFYNRARGSFSTIGGGGGNGSADSNLAVGISSTVAGGRRNFALGAEATAGGGTGNLVGGNQATIPGGTNNSAAGTNSLAAGKNARALHDGAFVWSDNSAPIFPSAFEVGFSPTADNFLVRATGGVVFVSAIDLVGNSTAAVRLAPGDGSWAALSDRNVKENVEPVNGEEVLAKLAAMPIAKWNYISQDDAIRHIGPMAQDFHAAFGVGEDDRHITTIDADGVALAAIQALLDRVKELEGKIKELEQSKN